MADLRGINQLNFAGIPALFRVPEIRPQIVDLYRKQKLMELFQWFGPWQKVTNDKYYTPQSQAGFYTLDTTTAVVTNSGTPVVTITDMATTQTGKAIVGDTLILPAGTQARIKSVTTAAGKDTIVIESYAAGTPNLTLVAGNTMRQFSNAQEEGSEAPTPRNRGVDYIYNQLGIKRKSYAATDIVKMQQQGTLYIGIDGKEDAYSIGAIQEYMQHRAEVAAGLFMDQMSDPNFSSTSPTVVGVNGRGVQTTRGLLPTIDAYGQSLAITTPGTIVNADIENLIGKIVDAEGPDTYAIIGGTRAITRLSNFFKGLGSSNTSPVRINLSNDERVIDFMVERVTIGGKQLDMTSVDVLDTTALFPTAGAEAKSVYAIPLGEVPILSKSGKGTSMRPYVGVNYGPVILPGVGTEMEAEVRFGALAPNMSNGTAVDQTTWESICGLETPKPQAMIKVTGIIA